jgi:hypothetical protein
VSGLHANQVRKLHRAGISKAEIAHRLQIGHTPAAARRPSLPARFFNRVREVANQTPDANAKKAYEDLLIPRDKITAELAKGEAGVMGDLQDLFVKTRKATGASAEQ